MDAASKIDSDYPHDTLHRPCFSYPVCWDPVLELFNQAGNERDEHFSFLPQEREMARDQRFTCSRRAMQYLVSLPSLGICVANVFFPTPRVCAPHRPRSGPYHFLRSELSPAAVGLTAVHTAADDAIAETAPRQDPGMVASSGMAACQEE